MSVPGGELALHIGTFLVWTAGVAVCTWFICKRFLRSAAGAADNYFAGGRALSWYIVAGSLMLTNLSTEQMVGLNGVIFKDGCLAGNAWETFAALAMCVTASVFLPRYMQSGLTTTTGFLGDRYDLATRTLVSLVFTVYYALGLCPSVLYTGALAIRNIFELHDVPLWVVCLVIGLIGACYAIFGGLKAVAVSDCFNGIGLIIVGLWVPLAAVQKLGGLSELFSEPELLLPLVSHSQIYDGETGTRSEGVPTIPWHVLLTGTMLVNLYYWSMNQLIVQRALAAKTLAEGQKGVLFAASMKVVGFTFLCMPGIIGMLMIQKRVEVNGEPFRVEKSDEVYPELVKAVMPRWSLGFFAAVLLGSVLSTFNSALNSASTLFGLELYSVYINPRAGEEEIVRVASYFGASLTLISCAIAPQLESVQSIFDWLQKIKTFCSLPIITIFLVGIYTIRPDAFSAKFSFALGAVIYCAAQFAVPEINFLHVFFLCFLLALVAMAAGTYSPLLRRLFGQATEPLEFLLKPAPVVDLTPWNCLWRIILTIVFLVAYLTFSLQMASMGLFISFWVLWTVAVIILLALPTHSLTSTPQHETASAAKGAEEAGDVENSTARDQDCAYLDCIMECSTPLDEEIVKAPEPVSPDMVELEDSEDVGSGEREEPDVAEAAEDEKEVADSFPQKRTRTPGLSARRLPCAPLCWAWVRPY